MSWLPEKRGPDDRMRIYRVLIRADVAANFGEKGISEEIEDKLGTLDHWDVLALEIMLRREDEDGISE
jgi:hypothetical protein